MIDSKVLRIDDFYLKRKFSVCENGKFLYWVGIIYKVLALQNFCKIPCDVQGVEKSIKVLRHVYIELPQGGNPLG